MLLLALLFACSGDDGPTTTDTTDTEPDSVDSSVVTIDSGEDTGSTSPTADTATSWCFGCMIQMRDGLSQAGSNIETLHPLELLSEAYGQ